MHTGQVQQNIRAGDVVENMLHVRDSVFSHTQPAVYLYDLRVYPPAIELRSFFDSRMRHIPNVKTKIFGHTSCSYAIPSVWNYMPRETRHIRPTTA